MAVVENFFHAKIKDNSYVPLEEEEKDERASLQYFRYLSFCCSCVFASILFVFFILLSGWLQASFSFSGVAMLSPIIIISCLICCCCVCCAFPIYACVVRQYSKEDEFIPSTTTEEVK